MDLKYLRQALFYFLTAVLSLVLITYAIYHTFDGFKQDVTTVSAEPVTEYEVLELDGYLMRSELLLYAPSAGEVGFLYDDGDKVSSGSLIGQVYALSSPEVREQILKLDEQIFLYEQSNTIAGGTLSGTTEIDRQISRLYLLLKNAQLSGDSEYICRKKNELLILTNRRLILTGKVDSFAPKIEALKAEREALTATFGGESGKLYAPGSGVFYAGIDGYETIFDAAKIDLLTVGAFEEMTQQAPLAGSSENGYAVGKLVTDYKWQLACEISLEQARDYEEGKTYSVLFPYNGDVELSMSLRRLLRSPRTGKAVLIFETGTSPENFNYLRMQSVQLVQTSYSGYRVPIGAVRLVDGVPGVYVLNGNYVAFRAICPLWEDGGDLIVAEKGTLEQREDEISWLGENEEIITEGKDLYDGKIIH